MEKTVINIAYTPTLNTLESELLTHLKGEWLNREDDLMINIHLLYANDGAISDLYKVHDINTDEDSVTLLSHNTEDNGFHLNLKDPMHLSYQVINQKSMGASKTYLLEKG